MRTEEDQWICSRVSDRVPNDPSYVTSLETSYVTFEQKKRLQELFDGFSDVFSRHQYDIGSCTTGKVISIQRVILQLGYVRIENLSGTGKSCRST